MNCPAVSCMRLTFARPCRTEPAGIRLDPRWTIDHSKLARYYVDTLPFDPGTGWGNGC